MTKKILRQKRRVKKDQLIVGKVDEKLKTAIQAALSDDASLEWIGGESAFVRKAAQALLGHLTAGEDIAQPLRFLTEDQRRFLDANGYKGKKK